MKLSAAHMVEADRLMKRYGPKPNGPLPSECEWAFGVRQRTVGDGVVLQGVICGNTRHFENLVVHPSVRRCGFAQALRNEASAHVASLGNSYAETYIEDINYPALAGSLRNGFRVAGYTFEQGKHFVLLVKKLSPSRRGGRAAKRR